VPRVYGAQVSPTLATLNSQHPTIQKILPTYQEAGAQDACFLNSGLGANHPKVKALRATKAVYAKELEEQMASIRSALEKNLTTAQTTRERMDKRLAEINTRQLATKTLSANYVRAKNGYIKERLLLDGIRMRAQTQTMELAMPRIAVSVNQVAEPPNFPARPRLCLNPA